MGALFDAMIAGGASQMLDEHFGESVSITRGPNTTTDVTASWDAQVDEVSKTDNKSTKIVDRFWFVKKSLYQILSTAAKPRQGDRLADDAAQKWEVLPNGPTPAVESYGGGDYWKISTKKVA